MEEFELPLDGDFNYFEWELKQNLRPSITEFFPQFFEGKKLSEYLKDEIESERCFYVDVEGEPCPNSVYEETLCQYHFERKCSIPYCRKIKVKKGICYFHLRILCHFKGCQKAKVRYNLCLEHAKFRCSTVGCYNVRFKNDRCRVCLEEKNKIR